MSYDNTCKFLAEEYPTDFVRWLLGMETEDINVLKTELFLEPIRAPNRHLSTNKKSDFTYRISDRTYFKTSDSL